VSLLKKSCGEALKEEGFHESKDELSLQKETWYGKHAIKIHGWNVISTD
jgi:hypothetical protein